MSKAVVIGGGIKVCSQKLRGSNNWAFQAAPLDNISLIIANKVQIGKINKKGANEKKKFKGRTTTGDYVVGRNQMEESC